MFLEGRVDRTRETPSVQVDRILPVEDAPRALARGLLLRIEEPSVETLRSVREALASTPGSLPVVLEFRPEAHTVARVKAGPGWSVAASDDLIPRLASLPRVAGAEYLRWNRPSES